MARTWIVFICLISLVGAFFVFGGRNASPFSKSTTPAEDASEQVQQAEDQDRQKPSPALPIVIPFRLTSANNIVVRAILNETNSLDLMFHTAFEGVALTREAVKSIDRLRWGESVEVQSWGGDSTSQVSVGNRLQMESLNWKDLTFIVDELSGPESSGKFGPDLFKGKVLEIDFDQLQLTIHDQVPPFATGKDTVFQRLTYIEDHGSIYVEAEFRFGDQAIHHPLLLHSGFGGTMLLDDEFVGKHDLSSKFPPIHERELKDSFGNSLRTRTIPLPNVRFGRFCFSNIHVEVFDGALGKQRLSVLGGLLIQRFHWIIDPANREVYIALSHRDNSDIEVTVR